MARLRRKEQRLTTGPNLLGYNREPKVDWEAINKRRDANRAVAEAERKIAEAERLGLPHPYADAEWPF